MSQAAPGIRIARSTFILRGDDDPNTRAAAATFGQPPQLFASLGLGSLFLRTNGVLYVKTGLPNVWTAK